MESGSGNAPLMSFITANLGWIIVHGKLKVCRYFAASCWILALIFQAQAVPLMEEGFNFPSGTGLAANPPWSGSIGSSVGVVSGNLMFGNLGDTTPAGNMLQIGGGGNRTVYRNFSTSPVAAAPGVAVYFSALINCTLLPTN